MIRVEGSGSCVIDVQQNVLVLVLAYGLLRYDDTIHNKQTPFLCLFFDSKLIQLASIVHSNIFLNDNLSSLSL